MTISLFLDNIDDLDRGLDFAKYVEKEQVWGILGLAQLKQEVISEAAESFLKAQHAQHYEQVIFVAERTEAGEVLIEFLRMVRTKVIEFLILQATHSCPQKFQMFCPKIRLKGSLFWVTFEH